MNISEKILKICEVKPNKLCYDCRKKDGSMIQDPEKECKFYPCGTICTTEIWADLENPQNFVKLLELKFFDEWTIVEHICYINHRGFINRVHFLKLLSKYLKEHNNEKLCEQMKQAIKNENWKF